MHHSLLFSSCFLWGVQVGSRVKLGFVSLIFVNLDFDFFVPWFHSIFDFPEWGWLPADFENHGRGLSKDLYVVAAMVVAWEAKTMREVNHALCEEMGISNLNVVCGFNHLLLASHLLIVYITLCIFSSLPGMINPK